MLRTRRFDNERISITKKRVSECVIETDGVVEVNYGAYAGSFETQFILLRVAVAETDHVADNGEASCPRLLSREFGQNSKLSVSLSPCSGSYHCTFTNSTHQAMGTQR